ncbi:uncharacterized protein [Hoplias malabaricus]|uniref:uncharacterized protein n=1 Tax=Hoplias malabaricus TaxID=27720 RepID=UPI003462289E
MEDSSKSRKEQQGGNSEVQIHCQNGLRLIHHVENISLTCSFTDLDVSDVSWYKHTPGERTLLIVSHTSTLQYHNDFNKSSRFKALKQQGSFNLNITNAEPSDSATYYCATSGYRGIFLSDCTVAVLNGSSSSLYTVLQTPGLDSVEVGGSTTLQCSVFTDASAGEHSVYWLRHGSGESPPGVIYTHGDTNSQCSRSSETDSPTQSCVYKLPKTNLRLSDAGIYYCAVAVCGQILIGNGTKLDFVERGELNLIIVVLATSNIISMAVVLYLCRKSFCGKDGAEGRSVLINQAACDKDLLAAAGDYTIEPLMIKEAEDHSQVIYYQQNRTS